MQKKFPNLGIIDIDKLENIEKHKNLWLQTIVDISLGK
jgi:hypothetical protein